MTDYYLARQIRVSHSRHTVFASLNRVNMFELSEVFDVGFVEMRNYGLSPASKTTRTSIYLVSMPFFPFAI